jgi:hypothetical protein
MPASTASARAAAMWAGLKIEADNPPVRVADRERERTKTLAAAWPPIRGQAARTEIEAGDTAQQAGEIEVQRRLMPVITGDLVRR